MREGTVVYPKDFGENDIGLLGGSVPISGNYKTISCSWDLSRKL